MTALLAPILQEFFTAHLVTQRAVSAATIRAYRDTWKLFLAFLSERENVPAHKLETNHVDATAVIAFLDYLEDDRGNSVATRNLRLAAIKATMRSRPPRHLSCWTPSREFTPSPSRSI